MSKPLSPLTSSYQNVRTRSPKIGSSPFLTKTLDDDASANAIPSSPLKQSWDREGDEELRSPGLSYNDENLGSENYNYHEQDRGYGYGHGHDDEDFQELPASSPFRPDAREDTVDFKTLNAYTREREIINTPPQKLRPTSHNHHHHHQQRDQDAEEEEEEQQPMSSPFRADVQDEPVDFNQLRDEQPTSPGLENEKRLALDDQDQDQEPESSPFRPEARDETVDFRRLREVQPLSPGLDRRLAVQDPASSPFRPDGRDGSVERDEFPPLSPDVEEDPVPQSSPFRADVRDEVPEVDEAETRELELELDVAPRLSSGQVEQEREQEPEVEAEAYSSPLKEDVQDKEPEDNFDTHDPLRESIRSTRESIGQIRRSSAIEQVEAVHTDVQIDSNEEVAQAKESPRPERLSIGRVKNSPKPVSRASLSSRKSPEETLEVQKLRSSRRSLPRASLGLEERNTSSATPRKRSFDQTPRGQEEEAKAQEPCKKGMVSRPDVPDIHVDIEEESSVIHNESLLSMTSAMQDRSTIANSMMEDKRNEGMSTVLHEDENSGAGEHSELGDDYHDSMDETGLSTFSVLPDMTSFAKLRAESPMKSMRGSVGPTAAHRSDAYRQSTGASTPGTARRSYRAGSMLDNGSPAGTPTPRRRVSRDIENPRATLNLVDFGDSVNFFPNQSMSMQQSARYSPSRRSPMRPMRQSIRSPSKYSSLLDLDYEMAPAPTPRSLPSITPRELESLKSGFMSEISSLKATLSGKDAEVASLKTAISDAERRVGEALEEVRNEAARRESLEMEQAEWDRRGNEMENVLRSVRSELVEGERERERLSRKADDAEKTKEQLEGRIVEIESQLSAARSAISESNANATASDSNSSSRNAPSSSASASAEATAREVQDAVEKVARELHTLYKGKHETKVAALKKSYESRWEKRLRESEKKLAAVRDDNERLRRERDAARDAAAAQSESMADNTNASMIARENDEHEAEKRVLEAKIQGLGQELRAIRDDSEKLRDELKVERAEKGDLVAAVDEWLAIQQGSGQQEQEREREESQSRTGFGEEYLEVEVSSASRGMQQHMEHDHGHDYERDYEKHRRSVSRSGSADVRPAASAPTPAPAHAPAHAAPASALRAPVTGEKRSRFGGPAAGHSRGNSGGKSGIAVFTPGRGGIMSSIERMGRGGAA